MYDVLMYVCSTFKCVSASLSSHSDGGFVHVFQLFVFNKESTQDSNNGYGPRTLK